MPPKQRKTRNSQRTSTPPTTETNEQIIERRVAEAIAQYEASRNRNDGGDNSLNTDRNNLTGNPGSTRRGCSYKTFLACKPTTFTGTEGAIGLVHWIEKMESVIDISDCTADDIVKYATCTLADKALTWWNAQVQVLGRTAASLLPWETLKQMMTEEFCPHNELQKLEAELWNIQMIGADITGYTTKFQELARLVPNMVTPESRRIERYNRGLAPQIRGMVMSSKPATFRSAVDLAQSLTDDAVRMGTLTEKAVSGKSEPNRTDAGDSGHNKRKWNNEGNDRQGQQNKNPGNTRAYVATTTPTGSKPYLGNKPKCDKCERHHGGECNYCNHCRRWGHHTPSCKVAPTNQVNNEPRNTGCFKCGETGHYRNQCPQLNNNQNNDNRNNQNNNTGNLNLPPARGRAYILRAPEAQPDPYANIGTSYNLMYYNSNVD